MEIPYQGVKNLLFALNFGIEIFKATRPLTLSLLSLNYMNSFPLPFIFYVIAY